MSIFANLSPLDHRYQASDPELWRSCPAFSQKKATSAIRCRWNRPSSRPWKTSRHLPCRCCGAGQGSLRPDHPRKMCAEEEEKTRHNIRALVNCIQREVDGSVRPFIHLSATSADIMDTARALQLRGSRDQVHPAAP